MARKEQAINENIPHFACLEYNCVCLSETGHDSHMKCHKVRPNCNDQVCHVNNDLICTHFVPFNLDRLDT